MVVKLLHTAVSITGSAIASLAHVGCGLVEDEDAGVLQQRAGHAQQLPLAGAQVGAALHQLSIQAALASSISA